MRQNLRNEKKREKEKIGWLNDATEMLRSLETSRPLMERKKIQKPQAD